LRVIHVRARTGASHSFHRREHAQIRTRQPCRRPARSATSRSAAAGRLVCLDAVELPLRILLERTDPLIADACPLTLGSSQVTNCESSSPTTEQPHWPPPGGAGPWALPGESPSHPTWEASTSGTRRRITTGSPTNWTDTPQHASAPKNPLETHARHKRLTIGHDLITMSHFRAILGRVRLPRHIRYVRVCWPSGMFVDEGCVHDDIEDSAGSRPLAAPLVRSDARGGCHGRYGAAGGGRVRGRAHRGGGRHRHQSVQRHPERRRAGGVLRRDGHQQPQPGYRDRYLYRDGQNVHRCG